MCDRPPRTGLLALFASLLLSACTVGHLFESNDPERAEPRPVNYRADILAVLHVYLNNPTGIRNATLSEPMLQPGGKAGHYVVCVRLDARKSNGEYGGLKEYIAVFRGGRVDQMVEAKGDLCGTAEYQPFPEAEAMVR